MSRKLGHSLTPWLRISALSSVGVCLGVSDSLWVSPTVWVFASTCLYDSQSVCLCVCAHTCLEDSKIHESISLCVCVHAHGRACVSGSVRAHACACVCICRGWWKIDGEELDLGIGVVSILSFPLPSLAARLTTEGTNSKDELPTASPTGVYGCALIDPLLGEPLGITEPSGIGTSAGSWFRSLRRGGSGTLDLPVSCFSISARLVLPRILFFILGLRS